MAVIKLFLLGIAILSALLGLAKILPLSIVVPAMFICFACTMFVSATEHKKKYDKNKTITYMMFGMLFIVIAVCSLMSNI